MKVASVAAPASTVSHRPEQLQQFAVDRLLDVLDEDPDDPFRLPSGTRSTGTEPFRTRSASP